MRPDEIKPPKFDPNVHPELASLHGEMAGFAVDAQRRPEAHPLADAPATVSGGDAGQAYDPAEELLTQVAELNASVQRLAGAVERILRIMET